MCGFDCKNGYKLSVFAIYLENQARKPIKHYVILICLNWTSTYEKMNKSFLSDYFFH